MATWEGFLFGIATVLLIGPVFFTLLHASLNHGVSGGVAVALGIILSDVIVVLICLSGLVAWIEEWMSGPWMALAGGSLLVFLGLRYIMRRGVHMGHPAPITRRDLGRLFTSGFLVNFVNPFVFAIWIGLAIHAAHAHGPGNGQRSFLLGVLFGILLTDIAKAVLAQRLRKVLTNRALERVHLVIGSVMLLFSIRVFVHAFSHWG
ncbi:MAG: LysE family transporter [Flavobacteriales bacterium]